MSESESLETVSRTALGVARVRAEESRRPGRLFSDEHAAAFVTAFAAAFPQTPLSMGKPGALREALRSHIVIRTRFYDDWLLAAGCRQVVVLAAGLDTRAFRLGWPAGVRLFELDLPAVLSFKEDVLARRGARARCERTVVPADLREDWGAELVAAGLDTAVPTAWLIEGLLIYLSAEQAAGLLTEVGALSAAGSRLAFEHGSAGSHGWLRAQARAVQAERLAELWQGGIGAETGEWLTERGWRVEVHEFETVAAGYRREGSGRSGSGFATAVYRAAG